MQSSSNNEIALHNPLTHEDLIRMKETIEGMMSALTPTQTDLEVWKNTVLDVIQQHPPVPEELKAFISSELFNHLSKFTNEYTAAIFKRFNEDMETTVDPIVRAIEGKFQNYLDQHMQEVSNDPLLTTQFALTAPESKPQLALPAPERKPHLTHNDLDTLKQSILETVTSLTPTQTDLDTLADKVVKATNDLKPMLESELYKIITERTDTHVATVLEKIDGMLKGKIDPIVHEIGLKFEGYLGKRMSEDQLDQVLESFQFEDMFAKFQTFVSNLGGKNQQFHRIQTEIHELKKEVNARTKELVQHIATFCSSNMTVVPFLERLNTLESRIADKQSRSKLKEYFSTRDANLEYADDWESRIIKQFIEAEEKYKRVFDQISKLAVTSNRNLTVDNFEQEIVHLFNSHLTYSATLEEHLSKSYQQLAIVEKVIDDTMRQAQAVQLQAHAVELFNWFKIDFENMKKAVFETQQQLNQTIQRVHDNTQFTIEDISHQYPQDECKAVALVDRGPNVSVTDTTGQQIQITPGNLNCATNDLQQPLVNTGEVSNINQANKRPLKRSRASFNVEDLPIQLDMNMMKVYFAALFVRYFQEIWRHYSEVTVDKLWIEKKIEILKN